ncbi:MAG: sigma-70 family RNA polymerase sigma factor [Anaerolineae bacterium]|jgi:RNA polymerase sigma-70 factor (ECF subfamily)|nr:sigma-70 family RNA polymerase sigma factor [Anaerolineae bacterium]
MRLFNRRTQPVDLSTLSDAELVEMARTDKAAFGELYERYVKRIYNYIYFRTGSPYDAEDLTARVFTRAMAHIGQYTDRGLPFQAWLYRIAHNLTANWHRDQGRRKVIPLEDYITGELIGDSPDHLVEDEEELETLRAAVRRLPEDRQQLLLLKFVDGLSNAEIGHIMDKTEGAIKSLYHRTLTALRDELQGRATDDEDDARRKQR